MIRIKNLTPARLPSEYQEVKYIESTGTQYINTGYNPNGDTKYELEIRDSSKAGVMFGAYNTTWTNGSGFYTNINNSSNPTDYLHYASNNQITGRNSQSDFTLIMDKGKVTFDGKTYVNGSTKTFSVTKPLYIFAGNMNGAVEQPTSYQLSYFKINDNNVLVRDYIPCYRKSDNAGGLYDLVEKKFYGNAGTGAFLIGEEVHKRDINIDPATFNIPVKRGYINGNLFYGTAPAKYEQLVNYTMLYDRGDECTSVTGGWYQNYSQANGSVTKNANNIAVKANGYSGSVWASKYSITHNTAIDFTAFEKAIMRFDFSQTSTSNGTYKFGARTDKAWAESDTDSSNLKLLADWATSQRTYTNKFVQLNMAEVNTSGYIHVCAQNNAPSSSNKPVTTTARSIMLVKTDDWQTLASKAGITASSIDDILTNSATLLNNEDAVEFMIYQCTGSFMVNAIQSSTFLTALNSSPYNTKIQANEHWNKFLSMVV